MNNKGYILIAMMSMMLLMAVTTVGLNRQVGMQARMAANQVRSIQIRFGQLAAIEHARWKILQDSAWRDPEGGTYVFEGVTYNRIVKNCTIPGYSDAVTVTVTAHGGLNPMTVHFRWQLVARSKTFTTLYIADKSNNRIRMVAGETAMITTVAGTGIEGYSGDGQPATSADIGKPEGLFVDLSGNLYIADTDNHRIRKVTADTGIIKTVAGNGTDGYSGDGGSATAAAIKKPRGVFVDGYNNIYIADTDNHRIRKVAAGTGIITTVAGNGTGAYSGDGGPATIAAIKKPRGVYVDAHGNIYIADTDNSCIRRVDASTGIIATVAGTGIAGYDGDNQTAIGAQLDRPHGLVTDSSNNIYLTDSWNNRIRKVDGTSGIITLVAGKGQRDFHGDGLWATKAKLNHPRSITMNILADLYIADTDNHCIRKIEGATEIITTVAGTAENRGYAGDGGPAVDAQLDKPHSVFARTTYQSSPPSWGFTAVPGL